MPLMDKAASTLSAALAAVRAQAPGGKLALSALTGGAGQERSALLGYRELGERIDRTRALFAAWGLAPGARVLVGSQDDAAVAVLVLACLEAGLCAVVVDPQGTPREAAHMLGVSAPAAAIVDEALAAAWPLSGVAHVLPIGGGAPAKKGILGRLVGRTQPTSAPRTYPAILAAHAPAPPATPVGDDLEAYVLFTSGSSARPKGVRISRRALRAHARTIAATWGFDPACRILNLLPLHHVDGLVQGVVVAWLCGASCLRPLRFAVPAAGDVLDAIYRDRATHFVGVPAILAILLDHADGYEDSFHGADFRFVVSTAGYLDERIWRAFEERFRTRVTNVYGLTETVTGSCFAGPDDATRRPGTVGRPVDCTLRVVDEEGHDAPAGGQGELWIAGEHLMLGYLDEPAATAQTLADGWLRTGDLATIDPEGLVKIVGRKKNLVISGGLNLQPEEITEVLEAIAGVREAVAFGVPDERFGEILVACVVPAASGAPGAITTDAVVTACRAELAATKVPRAIVLLDALPRGPSGKVVIPEVRRQFLEARRAAAATSSMATEGAPTGDLRQRLYAVAASAFQVPHDRLGPDASPVRTPGWDSFAHISFVAGIEEAFRIRLRTADVMKIRTLADAERVVRDRLAS